MASLSYNVEFLEYRLRLFTAGEQLAIPGEDGEIILTEVGVKTPEELFRRAISFISHWPSRPTEVTIEICRRHRFTVGIK